VGKANFILTDGSQRSVDIPDGISLAEYARQNSIPGILADCGCNLACATCHVYVAEEWVGDLPPPSSQETEMLEGTATPTNSRSRLSCQVVMSPSLDGLTVEIPEHQ
jgi:2Fe-2S ferredoxin